MLLKEAIDILVRRFSNAPDDSDIRSKLKSYFNLAYREIAKTYFWEHLKRTGEFVAIPNYTTGTATITKNSNVVTGSGTVWTAAMQGRYFQPQDSDNWYRIAYVSSVTELILESGVTEDSASSRTYDIWKRFNYLHSEVRVLLTIDDLNIVGRQLNAALQSGWYNTRQKMRSFSQHSFYQPFTVYGADPYKLSYTTGTSSITKDQNLLTGTGTAFLANVGRGDIIKISSEFNRVLRIESDTRIIMTNYSLTTFDGTHEFIKDNPLGIQLHATIDTNVIVPYTYHKRVFDLNNEDFDRTELPDDFNLAILDRAQALKMKDDNNDKWTIVLQESVARVEGLRKDHRVWRPPYLQFTPTIQTGNGR